MVNGITSANLGVPDYRLAQEQHNAYVDALIECGLTVVTLPSDDAYPDSTFVEDTMLLTPSCAIVMRSGAPPRRGETESVEMIVKEFYSAVERVEPPGTADAGDIMMVGDHYYIGLSGRTNEQGAKQIINILTSHGMTGSTIRLGNLLHLKSGVSYLEENTLVAIEVLSTAPEFGTFTIIHVPEREHYAANCLWINGTVLVASGYPETEQAIRARGYRTRILDVSEFRKLDGGLSCLSLRF